MRRAVSGLLAIAVSLAGLLPAAAAAQEALPVSVADVVARAAEIDGRAVVFEGEAIGEALRADEESVWVNVLAGGTAIGVWMPREMARPIERWGGYRQTGDTVRVTGVVNLACDEHGGDLDVHATSLEVVERGVERAETVRLRDGLVGAAGFALAAAAFLAARRRSLRGSEGE
ncbi:MAG: hypothetical protein QMD96_08305 [Anaerosomatales bacterium]|nr:hypothetical protein [Anaerosomatales bacterium]